MKIAVASNDHVRVSGHLGRCKSFVIYSVEDKKITNKEIRENTFTHHHAHHHHGDEENHHGHNHANLINGLKDCEVVIFNAGGWRIIEDLKANNIIPFLTEERIADEAAQKYINGELVETENNACSHH